KRNSTLRADCTVAPFTRSRVTVLSVLLQRRCQCSRTSRATARREALVHGKRFEHERIAIACHRHANGLAVTHVTRKNRSRQAVIDLLLHESPQRPSSVYRVIPARRQPSASFGGDAH